MAQESVALRMDATLLVYHELKIELEARCNGSVAGVSVKNTECFDTADTQDLDLTCMYNTGNILNGIELHR